jgi:hypothetical protein
MAILVSQPTTIATMVANGAFCCRGGAALNAVLKPGTAPLPIVSAHARKSHYRLIRAVCWSHRPTPWRQPATDVPDAGRSLLPLAAAGAHRPRYGAAHAFRLLFGRFGVATVLRRDSVTTGNARSSEPHARQDLKQLRPSFHAAATAMQQSSLHNLVAPLQCLRRGPRRAGRDPAATHA